MKRKKVHYRKQAAINKAEKFKHHKGRKVTEKPVRVCSMFTELMRNFLPVRFSLGGFSSQRVRRRGANTSWRVESLNKKK